MQTAGGHRTRGRMAWMRGSDAHTTNAEIDLQMGSRQSDLLYWCAQAAALAAERRLPVRIPCRRGFLQSGAPLHGAEVTTGRGSRAGRQAKAGASERSEPGPI